MKHSLILSLVFALMITAGCSSKESGPKWYENAAFVKALEISDFQTVSGYIYTSNINLKSKTEDGDTPLTLVMPYTTDAKLIQSLIDAGVDTSAVNNDGYSALLLAAKDNINPNIAKAIIMTGVDIEQADPAGRTPLMLAAANNKNKNVVILLLQAGAQGRASQEFREAVELNTNFTPQDKNILLKAKIGLTVKVPWYNSAEFKKAFEEGDTKILARAAAKTDLKAINPATNADASTLLEENKNPQVLFIFAKNGVNIDTRDKDGKTMLHRAVEQGDTPRIKDLLKAKSNPNTLAKDGSSPLFSAIFDQPENTENINLLIKAGAALNAGYGKDKGTLLSKIMQDGQNLALAEILIKAGADPNIPNNYGDTPLMVAAKHAKDEKPLEFLLNNKANINLKNGQGFTALLTAAANNQNPAVTIALMKKSENKLDEASALDFAGQNPNSEVYNELAKHMLAEENAKKNANDKNDTSIWFNNKALVSAIRNNNIPVLKRETAKKLNLEALMQGQFNALMLAAAFSKTGEPIKILVAAGAEINGTNNNGDTPLMTAALTNKNLAVVQALVEAGADVNASDLKGTNALMAAAGNNPNEKIPVFLLQSGANVDNTRIILKYAESNKNKKVYEVLKKLFTVPAGQSRNS